MNKDKVFIDWQECICVYDNGHGELEVDGVKIEFRNSENDDEVGSVVIPQVDATDRLHPRMYCVMLSILSNIRSKLGSKASELLEANTRFVKLNSGLFLDRPNVELLHDIKSDSSIRILEIVPEDKDSQLSSVDLRVGKLKLRILYTQVDGVYLMAAVQMAFLDLFYIYGSISPELDQIIIHHLRYILSIACRYSVFNGFDITQEQESELHKLIEGMGKQYACEQVKIKALSDVYDSVASEITIALAHEAN